MSVPHPMSTGNTVKRIAVILLWLAVWQLAAMLVRNSVLLAGPLETLSALFRMAGEAAFRLAVLSSCSRILAGLLAGILCGVCAAAIGFCFPFVHTLLSPLVSALKSVPVACFVVMLLLWAGRGRTTVIVTALVVFPVLYFNTRAGLFSADRELLDIAALFSMTKADRVRHIYLPALYPHLASALRIAAGMSWKSGVAAEVIALQKQTLGNELNTAKTLLETDRVFAVTLTVVVLSVLTERVLILVLKRIGRDHDA